MKYMYARHGTMMTWWYRLVWCHATHHHTKFGSHGHCVNCGKYVGR